MSDTIILRQLFSAYPNSQATVETIAIYDRLLSDIPASDLQTVIDQCIAKHKFLPTVAEIREEWHNLTFKLGQPTAMDAWGEVMREIRRVGYIGTPEFNNPITAQVVKAMGWRDLCISENAVADRAHFMRRYDELLALGNEVEKLLPQALEMAQERIGGGLQPISKLLITKKPDEN